MREIVFVVIALAYLKETKANANVNVVSSGVLFCVSLLVFAEQISVTNRDLCLLSNSRLFQFQNTLKQVTIFSMTTVHLEFNLTHA